MIQDIEPLIFDNQYSHRQALSDADVVLCYSDKNILARRCADENELVFPRVGELAEAVNGDVSTFQGKLVYAFSLGDVRYHIWIGESPIDASAYMTGELCYRSMYRTRGCHPKEAVFAAATGWHLNLWYDTNRFCGRCGSRMTHDFEERMLVCPDCGRQEFPMIAPAVIVGVTCGDRIILTTYAGREYKRYALIAGFTEIGESAEETVRREVMEEVGIPVKNIRYYKSQPWGFDSNLLMGFFCEADVPDGNAAELRIDRRELATGEWVDRADIPDYHENLSLTHEMMMYFKNGGRLSGD